MVDFSLVTAVFESLDVQPPSRLVLLEAATLSSAHVPSHPPDTTALLTGVDSQELALHLREVLLAIYPKEHEVLLVNPNNQRTKAQSPKDKDGSDRQSDLSEANSVALRLGDFVIDQKQDHDFSEFTCLYIPPLGVGTSFESFAEIVAHLRAPNGCPWDREQTHKSLRTHLLEETYEALAAIDTGDFMSMREELGDLLLQIVLQAQIASEAAQFTLIQVVQSIYDKIIRRHPHVFGDLKLSGVEGVLQNWEKLKEQERRELALSRRAEPEFAPRSREAHREGKQEEKGLLDGIPLALPALSQAQEYQDRAARVGFDWPVIEGVLDKVKEEIEEIKQAENIERVTSELGDLFFVLVNLARWKKIDAESSLREANARFKQRFAFVEQGARAKHKLLTEMSLEEMDALWEAGKKEND